MKEIKAIIQPQRLGKLRNAFRQMRGFPGMTVSRVEGCSQHDEPEVSHSIREELTDFSPKVRVEIVAPDDKVDEIVGIILANGHTGQPGDGIIWVTEIGNFQRIRIE
ncbi:P-II family nitrogen regulator [Methylocaldum sp.]|uniref:P-II family nitrogen regulator n=1 Tax=Methylocaldum sp. TaxID=1969727 RepID=UPI002D611813|nr:P-II family nitrogen regulator [Methylocaldum sp.]HYE36170.1 P-II family nitrogen regulator [Methylocaldum sp.]